MDSVAVLAVILVAAVASAIVVGTAAASRRAGDGEAEPKRLGGRAAAAIALWLALSGMLAARGVLSHFDARPPPMAFILVVPVATLVFVTRTRAFRRLAAAAPIAWPIALQSMRLPIELGLWALASSGRISPHLTFEGRNFDVLTGISAPLVAWLAFRGKIGRRGLLAWNVAGLVLLANIVFRAVTSIPGPLHVDWPGIPNTVVTTFPFVWLPGFLVPVALFLHLASLRQLGSLPSDAKPR